MIWFYLLIPVLILGSLAIFFEKKSGMSPTSKTTDEQIDNMAKNKNQENNHNIFF